MASDSQKISWWLWPNVLNLDAPLVAVTWQEAFAWEADVTLSWQQRALLFLSVWAVYFADRWLDARSATDQQAARHRLHGLNRGLTVTLGSIGALGAVALACTILNTRAWIIAGVMMIITSLYLVWTHLLKKHPLAPKELWVGLIFAAGCSLQVESMVAVPQVPGLIVGAILFAAVAYLNCAFITVWENLPADQANPDSLLNRFPGMAKSLPLQTLGVVVVAIGSTVIFRGSLPAISVGLAAASLLALKPEWNPDLLRVLADLVLLSPLLLMAMAKAMG